LANASIDHMLALIIFIAALILFIGLFSQTIQTAVTYEAHTTISTKTSDLLDTILLNPGLPNNASTYWAQIDKLPVGFGLQDPAFSQYKLSSFSSMRLTSTTQAPVYYPRTSLTYNNLTAGYGSCLLTSTTKTVNYSTASKLLGINGTYGFKLTLTPTVTVSIQKTSTGAPLQFHVDASGTGLVLANANVTSNLILVNEDANEFPSYTIMSKTDTTAEDGSLQLQFPGVNGETRTYAIIVYSYLYGLKGMGYYVHVPQTSTTTLVPLVDSFQDRTLTLAHGDSVGETPQNPGYSQLNYNASFAILTEEYTLRRVILEQPTATGKIDYGPSSTQQYASVQVPDNAGILIATYKNPSSGQYGIVLVPWGLGSMAYSVSFGGNSAGQDWVTTDIRQVTIGGIAYQAELALWNLQHSGST
jgi:hypothetical protein